MTVNELIKILQDIPSRERENEVAISINGEAENIESVDWMDTSDALLLFIKTESH